MMAQQTKARMAVRGCRRPWRLRGSGISAKKESRLLPSDASMLRLRAAVQRKAGCRRLGRFSYPPSVKLSTAVGADLTRVNKVLTLHPHHGFSTAPPCPPETQPAPL